MVFSWVEGVYKVSLLVILAQGRIKYKGYSLMQENIVAGTKQKLHYLSCTKLDPGN